MVFLRHGSFVVKVNCKKLQKVDEALSDNEYVSNFHKDKKPFCKTNDTSKSKVDHDQILSEVTKSSNTNIPFDTPIDRLTSNKISNLVKPTNSSNEAENQQMASNETPTDSSRETESQLVTFNKVVNESNKNTKKFYKT